MFSVVFEEVLGLFCYLLMIYDAFVKARKAFLRSLGWLCHPQKSAGAQNQGESRGSLSIGMTKPHCSPS